MHRPYSFSMSRNIVIVGAGINGLVAANYLIRAGHNVTLIEKKATIGGACAMESFHHGEKEYQYPSGASVLGLMQDFVFNETGLSKKLKTFVPESPKLAFFPGLKDPTYIYRDPIELDTELKNKWGESGDARAFRADEAKIINFIQSGYQKARTPSIDEAKSSLGSDLVKLWITGDARSLMNHYFESDFSKIYMAMTVTESGPVSLSEKYSAFTIPIMDSGSIFKGYYGFVFQGIWNLTQTLSNINIDLGIDLRLSSSLVDKDLDNKKILVKTNESEEWIAFDDLVLATDPFTAHSIIADFDKDQFFAENELTGSSGKMNLFFSNPIQWKEGVDHADSDSAFRFIFSVDTLDAFESASQQILSDAVQYAPGFMQIYCEGAADRRIDPSIQHDRIAVFFKNLSLNSNGKDLGHIEQELKQQLFRYIENPEDCFWSKLSTPKDLKEMFYFPSGNIDQTMLTNKQMYFDRTFSSNPSENFYGFLDYENIYYCGAAAYPCGSIAGTPGYMCSQQIIRNP